LRPRGSSQYEAEGSNLDERTDRELLAAAAEDPAAFEELYRRHVETTIRFAARRTDRPADVVDLVAAVWLEVVDSVERYKPHRGDALPWILGIAANLCASERRRTAREREAIRRLGGRRPLDADDFERLEWTIDAQAAAPPVRRRLRELPPSERAVAELVFLDGLAPSEAAEALGLRSATVRMRLTRARRKLRAAVQDAAGTHLIEEVTW
jgi:RNA polymerase sigma-70 factor (ECF subfamily)